MTAPKQVMNPFVLPGNRKSPMRPLQPWKDPEHRDLYVPVDSTQIAFREFVDAMGDLREAVEEGHLVLVTGDTGCGKSALVNRCADWLVAKAAERGLTGRVVDLAGCLEGKPEQAIEPRQAEVCDRLLGKLIDLDLLHPGASEHLRATGGAPHQVFPRIGGALRREVLLIVLLPSPKDLDQEVVRYASGMQSGRVLYLVESADLTQAKVDSIVQRSPNSAITALRVGFLAEGDVIRFATDRIKRWATTGVYPRLSPEALEFIENASRQLGIGTVQRLLYETYQSLSANDLKYSEDYLVTPREVGDHFVQVLRATNN